MARSTHQKQLERARARRRAERDEKRRSTTVVVSVVAGLVVFAVALAIVLLVRNDGEPAAEGTTTDSFATDAETAADAATDSAGQVEPCPAPTGELPTPTTTPYDEMPAADLGGAEDVTATIRTTCGDVVVELAAAEAPTTVANFVGLARDGYYDGVGFHRVIDGFMVQGGDPTGTGTGCVDAACETRLPGYSFEDELGLAEQVVEENAGYPRGTLAMANAGPDTNGSQFFIVQASPAYPLPADYAVFGSVVEGMDVVDRIAVGPADRDLAIDPVVILGVDVQR